MNRILLAKNYKLEATIPLQKRVAILSQKKEK